MHLRRVCVERVDNRSTCIDRVPKKEKWKVKRNSRCGRCSWKTWLKIELAMERHPWFLLDMEKEGVGPREGETDRYLAETIDEEGGRYRWRGMQREGLVQWCAVSSACVTPRCIATHTHTQPSIRRCRRSARETTRRTWERPCRTRPKWMHRHTCPCRRTNRKQRPKPRSCLSPSNMKTCKEKS